MTCEEAREYIFAFLDNELEAPLSMALQHHIDHCPLCAREVEIERAVQDRLTHALHPPAPEVPLPRQALERTPSRDEAAGGWPRRAVLAACAAVVLGGALTAYVMVQRAHVDQIRAGFVSLAVRDFEHFLEEGRPIHFASSNANAVSAWLLEQTNLEVILPEVRGPNCRLLGARRCTIADKPAAFVVYDMDRTPVSLLAVTGDAAGLAHMNQVESDGRVYWVDRVGQTSVLAYRRNNLVYAVVSRLTPPELMDLFSGTAHESH